MIDPKILDDLAKRLADALPSGIRDLQRDVEKNFRAVLQAGFSKLDLVTREEFEVQAALLNRTRTKVDTLEKQVADMESVLKNMPK